MSSESCLNSQELASRLEKASVSIQQHMELPGESSMKFMDTHISYSVQLCLPDWCWTQITIKNHVRCTNHEFIESWNLELWMES